MKRLWKSPSFGPILKDAAHGSTPDICLWLYNNLSSIDEHPKEAHDGARTSFTQETVEPITHPSQHETTSTSTLSMQSLPRRHSPTHRSRWQPPRAAELRLDVACVSEDSGRFGTGGIVRDCEGSPLLAFGREFEFSTEMEVLERELVAIKEGLEVCHEAGFLPAIVCSDSVLAVREVTAECGRRSRSRVDALSVEIKELLQVGDGTNLEFAHESSNSVARSIAKFVSLVHVPCVWVAGEFPCWLQELVHGDIMPLLDE